jgi:hypothetical protein
MPSPLESNFLMPTGTFLLYVAVAFVVFAVLVVWPLVETVVRQQWGYLLGVILLGPIGGLVWFIVGRRETARRTRRDDEARVRATQPM